MRVHDPGASLAEGAPLPAAERERLGAVLRPLGESFALPGAAYTSPDVFAWEMGTFFASGWVCVGRSADLERAGDQAAFAVGDDGVVLVRGEDGALRGFFNVCRHRGHELLEVGGSASRGTIQCPYHAWAYRLDGRLLGAPVTRTSTPTRSGSRPRRWPSGMDGR